MSRSPEQEALFLESGKVETSDKLVSFLYLLLRNHLPAGVVAEVVKEVSQFDDACTFTNGFLAKYAEHLAGVLRK